MRETDTNSGADSKGVVRFGRWELEGEAYLYIVVGAVLTVLAFLMTMGWGSWRGLRCRCCRSLGPPAG